eukprot:4102868-Pyramimonas_sp.AAC.1
MLALAVPARGAPRAAVDFLLALRLVRQKYCQALPYRIICTWALPVKIPCASEQLPDHLPLRMHAGTCSARSRRHTLLWTSVGSSSGQTEALRT